MVAVDEQDRAEPLDVGFSPRQPERSAGAVLAFVAPELAGFDRADVR